MLGISSSGWATGGFSRCLGSMEFPISNPKNHFRRACLYRELGITKFVNSSRRFALHLLKYQFSVIKCTFGARTGALGRASFLVRGPSYLSYLFSDKRLRNTQDPECVRSKLLQGSSVSFAWPAERFSRSCQHLYCIRVSSPGFWVTMTSSCIFVASGL
jgi:hypothetical protein